MKGYTVQKELNQGLQSIYSVYNYDIYLGEIIAECKNKVELEFYPEPGRSFNMNELFKIKSIMKIVKNELE